MKERNTAVPASYLILEQEGKILVSRRTNTGYRDGEYQIAAGHVEHGELPTAAIIREAREELGITLRSEDVSVVHVSYRQQEDETGERLDIYFKATAWEGEVVNGEPEKCEDLHWVAYDELPEKLTPHTRHAIECVARGQFYSEL